MAEKWALPAINGTMGKTPEEVLNYCDSGRGDWANWAMRDMRRWMRELREYEKRVIEAMRSIEEDGSR